MEEKSKEISRQLNSGYCVKMVHLRREEHKIKIVENGILHLCYFFDYGPRTNPLVVQRHALDTKGQSTQIYTPTG